MHGEGIRMFYSFLWCRRLLDTFSKCYENERNGVSLGSSVKCVDAFRIALT